MTFIHFLHSKRFTFIHRSLAKIFLSQMDYLVVQSRSSQQTANALLPQKKVVYVRGPTFHIESREREMVSKAAARKKLLLEGDVLLFFGFVRPYKGLRFLLAAMPAILKEHSKLTLLIVGEYWGDQAAYEKQIDALGIREHVKIVNQFVSDEEVPLYFSAADAVVLPYSSITQSAVIPTALSFGVPILATNITANAEWVQHEKNGLLFASQNPSSIAAAVHAFYSQKLEKKLRAFIAKNFDEWKWTLHTEKLILDTSK